ncbi:MAG: DMT family transporter [Limibacillus sp.]|jgi:drug/metabolite transporter (DMT)-like permease
MAREPSPLSARFDALTGPVQGALMMTLGCLGFSAMNILIRYASAELDPFQIAFFRNLFALVLMLPWLAGHWPEALSTKRFKLHFWRAAVGLTAMLLWFYSVAVLPLSEAVALNFTVPLFATAGAALVLGEVVRARRWTATVIGFLGVLIIIRPGFSEVTWIMALPVVAAAFMAASVLLVKTLSATEAPVTIVLYMNLLLTPLSLIPALFVWQWPSVEVWLAVIATGFIATGAQIMVTRAYKVADASVVLPFDYTRLPFIAVMAWLVFGQTTDLWTWIGAGVIAASSIYIAHRESRIARERVTQRAASAAPQGR